MTQHINKTPLSDTSDTYGAVSRLNHWIIAFAMIGMLFSGLFIANGPLSREAVAPFRDWHKAIGVLVLGYGVWRIGWRLVQGFPAPASVMPQWQETLAKLVHWGLLVTVLAMPLSGVMMSIFNGRAVNAFGLVIPAQAKVESIAGVAHMVHEYGTFVFGALLILHIAAALRHQFIDHDATMRRMTRG